MDGAQGGAGATEGPTVSAGRIRDLLHYDKDSGVFFWRIARRGTAKAGSIAGRIDSGGYCEIGVDGKLYRAHRLAWLHFYGEWPAHQVDHINGIRSDNRIANLRLATNSENHFNRIRPPITKSVAAPLGVSWSRSKKKWRAQITLSGIAKHLGYFKSQDAALAAYIEAKSRLHVISGGRHE